MMKSTLTFLAVSMIGIFSGSAHADGIENVRIDTSATFSRIEQQVKTEVGSVRGQRLVEQTEFATEIVATYNFWGPLSGGMYAQVDVGRREAGRFDGFDASGATVISNETGGSFRELWLGPVLRGQYRGAFAEVGYGLATFRKDKGRSDLPSEDGDSSSSFRTLPTVSWSFAVGGKLQVSKQFDVTARLIWRIRYYDRRGGSPLADNIVHGTQSYQPFVGVAWFPGRH